ncbi:MAG: chemotaxis protein CheW [Oscillospiraceae bacterium]|nr:chemotaxis protein CheW [Oscillospiraceae bacterium]
MENIMNRSWLLFRIQKVNYAVESKAVVSILQEAGKVTPLPQSDPFVRGIMLLRGSIVPLLDLRLMLGLPTVEREYKEFVAMLDARKKDHLVWASELRRCAETGQPFTLADDPHKCAFGKWYDSFEPQNRTIAFHMRKIEEPHKELHDLAKYIEPRLKEGKTLQDDPDMADKIEEMDERLVPNIVGLLDEAIEIFESSYRQMVVTLEYQDEKFGLLVDEVDAVRTFEGGLGEAEPEAEKFGRLPYVDYVDEQLGIIRVMQLKDLFSVLKS